MGEDAQDYWSSPRRNWTVFSRLNESNSNAGDDQKDKQIRADLFLRRPLSVHLQNQDGVHVTVGENRHPQVPPNNKVGHAEGQTHEAGLHGCNKDEEGLQDRTDDGARSNAPEGEAEMMPILPTQPQSNPDQENHEYNRHRNDAGVNRRYG